MRAVIINASCCVLYSIWYIIWYCTIRLKWDEIEMRWDEIEMRWDEIEMRWDWDEMRWDEIEMRWDWNEMRWDEIEMRWDEFWIELRWDEIDVSLRLAKVYLKRDLLSWIELVIIELDWKYFWIELNWVQLSWNVNSVNILNWIFLSCIVLLSLLLIVLSFLFMLICHLCENVIYASMLSKWKRERVCQSYWTVEYE